MVLDIQSIITDQTQHTAYSPLHPYPMPALEVIRLTTPCCLVPPSLEHFKGILEVAIKP